MESIKSFYNQDVKSWVRNKPMNWCRILSIISGKLKIAVGNLSVTWDVSVAEKWIQFGMPATAAVASRGLYKPKSLTNKERLTKWGGSQDKKS